MACRLKKHLDLLKVLYTAPPRLRKAILQCVHNDVIKCLADCSHNILVGTIKLSGNQRVGLRRLKKKVRLLAGRKTRIGTKRKTLVQTGGLSLALLAPIIGIAASLIGQALQK